MRSLTALGFLIGGCGARPQPAATPSPPVAKTARVAVDAETLVFPRDHHSDGDQARTLTCTAIEGGAVLATCREDSCAVSYRATRVETGSNGFQVLDRDVEVDRDLEIQPGAGSWLVREDARGLHVELSDRGTPILVVDGYLGGGAGSEGGVWRSYYGVAMTPGAEVRLFDGISQPGRAPTTPHYVDELRVGVTCDIHINFHE